MENTTDKKKTWECPQIVNIDKELIQLNSGPGSDAGPGSTHS
ncbi:hypothetical protein [Mucilaginibacter paludis]|uniref:Uncharacterized protein n=1 Tax=Mucilaginibacter paludis DSM 18603 TaxID=714943 RepID=H1Y2B7_9SPHI|nr:hypothetical protein [Mucilaginibacter paludis]EHQ27897.1 hypothetical protein Mucpa_3800 [Mucilaginibacter paludis DSM 18603]